MKKKTIVLILLTMLMATALTACGKSKDINVLVMGQTGISGPVETRLQSAITKLVPSVPVQVNASALFSEQKLLVEIAAGGNSLLIMPYNSFKLYAKQGGFVVLDSMFDKTKYKDGIATYKNDKGAEETHLVGIPVKDSAWFKEAKYPYKDNLYAAIPQNAPSIEDGKKILKAIMGQ